MMEREVRGLRLLVSTIWEAEVGGVSLGERRGKGCCEVEVGQGKEKSWLGSGPSSSALLSSCYTSESSRPSCLCSREIDFFQGR